MAHLDDRLAAPRPGPVAVLYIDVDWLKSINDYLGHCAGDWFIRAFAQRLRVKRGRLGVIARIGGDEFVFVPNQPMPADYAVSPTCPHGCRPLESHSREDTPMNKRWRAFSERPPTQRIRPDRAKANRALIGGRLVGTALSFRRRAGQAVTWIAEDGEFYSVLIRLCAKHCYRSFRRSARAISTSATKTSPERPVKARTRVARL
jgi:hypothetical protein